MPELATHAPISTLVSWVAAHVFHASSPLVDDGQRQRRQDLRLGPRVLRAGRQPAPHDGVDRLDRQRRQLRPAAVVPAVPALRARDDDDRLRDGEGDSAADAGARPDAAARAVRKLLADGRAVGSIGASKGYEMFAGFAELAGGVLLFVPRTGDARRDGLPRRRDQIFTLNMTYDVPVKLFSFHLIVMSLVLLAPRAPQLHGALVFNRPARRSERSPPLVRTPAHGASSLIAVQIAFGVYIVGMNAYGARQVLVDLRWRRAEVAALRHLDRRNR